jgi:hypothetical protein
MAQAAENLVFPTFPNVQVLPPPTTTVPALLLLIRILPTTLHFTRQVYRLHGRNMQEAAPPAHEGKKLNQVDAGQWVGHAHACLVFTANH